jgi:UDP-N-acetylglucosamine diphosphorylase/glucosamine-1-phosphate N-acetyltransferase
MGPLAGQQCIIAFEDFGFADLLPLVYWRSVFELQLGRKIALDRIAQRIGAPVAGIWTRDWIAPVAVQRCGVPANHPADKHTVLVNGRWLTEKTPRFAKGPCAGIIGDEVAYVVCDATLAPRLKPRLLLDANQFKIALDGVPRVQAGGRMLRRAWDLIGDLSAMLEQDWDEADAGIETELDASVVVRGRERVHLGERARVDPFAFLDATTGPIYISHDCHVGAFSVIEGPAYIGPGTRIMPHTRLHGGVGIGPVCRIGGEVCGCVINGYTNKQHHGFLGHSYIGSWVNFGAGATNSNLKNTYGKVRVPLGGSEVDTERQFFGAIVADHAKIGINAAIPTGAVIGLSASIAATRLLPKYLPSFAWVTDDGVRKGDPPRMLDIAVATMARRNVEMTDAEVELLLDLGDRVREYEKPLR